MRYIINFLMVLLIVSIITGCGSSSSSTPVIPTSIPTAIPTTSPTSIPTAIPTTSPTSIPTATVITPEGGTFTVAAGSPQEGSVTFQNNSVTRDVTCTGGIVNLVPSLPLEVQMASSVYSFSISDTTAYNVAFPAYVTLPVTLSSSILPENVTVFHSSNGVDWDNIGGTLNSTRDRISTNIPSFSYFVATILLTGPSGKKIFFLHHSVGNDLVERGNVRETINTYNSSHGTSWQFWDHGYNGDGLRDASGNYTGTNYNIPGDNTEPEGLAYLFTSSDGDAVSSRNQIMTYDVIVFKSCFTASQALVDDDTLNSYKNYYLQMRNFFDLHPEKVFIVISPPPAHPGETDSTTASRARQFANWLKSSEYLSGHSNVVCFDLFDQFADNSNVLKAFYRYNYVDSHPNELADQTVGPIFAQFLMDAVNH